MSTEPSRPEIDFPGDQPPTELVIEDVTVGDGAEATAGRTVSRPLRRRRALHRRGVRRLVEPRRRPWTSGSASGMVIPGWDQGIAGMKVGGRRRLTIPPHLGYGDRGAGGAIPPGETLIFVVDLMDVR